MDFILLAATGLIAAIVGSLIGLGGGIVIVPVLIFLGAELGILEGITPQIAVGTSSLVLVFIGLSSVISYNKNKQVDWKNGKYLLYGIIPGAMLGSYTSSLFTVDSLKLYFGLFIILVSFILLIRDKIKPMKVFQDERYVRPHTDGAGEVHYYGFPPYIGVIGSLLAGFAAGLFGVGGGALMTPMMIILFLMPPSIAVGTSMFLVLFGSVSSATGHLLQGNIHFFYALTLIPAAYLGAKIGVKLNRKLDSNTVVFILRMVLLLLGIYMIIDSW
ncbi:MAG: sulfite exporter TauE/SafE family protein [Jeotgalicoccus sp.]|nr:sulfite exporter TauE/SafE family protein [Jeotgalicoccus sp.]